VEPPGSLAHRPTPEARGAPEAQPGATQPGPAQAGPAQADLPPGAGRTAPADATTAPPDLTAADAPAGPDRPADALTGLPERPLGEPFPPPTGSPPSAGDEPAVEDVPVGEALRVAQLADEVVVVDGHPRYHLADCPTLPGATTIPLAVSAARRGGFTPCAVCGPDRVLLARSRARRAGGKGGA
jgi:hypothetical protein